MLGPAHYGQRDGTGLVSSDPRWPGPGSPSATLDDVEPLSANATSFAHGSTLSGSKSKLRLVCVSLRPYAAQPHGGVRSLEGHRLAARQTITAARRGTRTGGR